MTKGFEDKAETTRIERVKAEITRVEQLKAVEGTTVIAFVEQVLGIQLTPWQRSLLAPAEHPYLAGYQDGLRDARAEICRREGHNLAEVTGALERGQGIKRGVCRRCPAVVVTQTKTWTE